MNRFACPHIRARIAVIAGALTLVLPAGAAGASLCSGNVLDDWSDNGRIDRVFPLDCYEEAIETIPADLRDYTDAVSVIERALAAAIRSASEAPADGTAAEAVSDVETSASSFPVALVALGSVALAVLTAGGLAWIARRRSGQ